MSNDSEQGSGDVQKRERSSLNSNVRIKVPVKNRSWPWRGACHPGCFICRACGPYWWLLKKIFLHRDFLEFGEHINGQWYDVMDSRDDVSNLVVAFAYEDARFQTVDIFEGNHILADANEDGIEYVSSDEEMDVIGKS